MWESLRARMEENARVETSHTIATAPPIALAVTAKHVSFQEVQFFLSINLLRKIKVFSYLHRGHITVAFI